jgi:3-oxoacyl-[acyl-carrier protein] reductase
MDLDLNQRVYIVAEGATGLGWAAAECLVREGARVVISGRSEQDLQAAAHVLGESAAVFVVADSADPDASARLVAAAQTTWGRLDGALVRLGDQPSGGVMDVTDEEWTTAFESVFMGAVRLCRHIAHSLPSGGSLALVLSSSIYEPLAELAIANGFQRGLAAIALQLADELGSSGVRVNGLLPGAVAMQLPGEPGAAGDPDPGRATPIETIPLRRHGAPEEFGRVAAFILSPAASYISGSMIPIDGGMLRSL